MSLLRHHQISEHTFWGMWEIEETLEDLLDIFPEAIHHQDFTAIHIELKQKQWLASRILIQKLLEIHQLPYAGISKDEFNKAILLDSDIHLSISHCKDYAIAIIDTKKSTGIDIELVSPRIQLVAKKFLSDFEKNNTCWSDEELTIYWCAKEAMYKLYGRKQLFFNKELKVIKNSNATAFTGEIIKDEITIPVEMISEKFGDYIIVYCK
ncbi:4'-phosphopantetheinyl transferase family protein [Flexithrix dorotheae]|uniref:4'-phosphopantetheinyl transferase family protein n=1 Tax=Flexithrix dorotheae TaxID=70993 RepID=UPI000365C8D2|nr:4'-phosphopantetheinyl transferase superfamily protein [Flexithrix dorotheae]